MTDHDEFQKWLVDIVQSTRYYDRDSNPLTMQEWSDLVGGMGEQGRWEYSKVARTDLVDGRWVSTVWLGIDHNYRHYLETADQRPHIFETMAFDGRDMHGLAQWRYSTEAEAKDGHQEMVGLLMSDPDYREWDKYEPEEDDDD